MSDDIALTFSYGHFTFKATFEFLIALLFSMGVVFVFSMQKFGESTLARDEDDPTTQLLPKHLATREQYSHALILYVTIMVSLVVVLSLLGPRAFAMGASDVPKADAALPLFGALVLVGALPNVPWLQELEKALRRFAHRRAFIPNGARADATRLKQADFDFSQFCTPEILGSPAMRCVEAADFGRPRSSLEYNWARLSCLVYQIREVLNGGTAASLDDELLRSYGKDVDQIVLRRRAMEDDIGEYRDEKAKNPQHEDDELQRKIMHTLSQLYVLLTCGARLRGGSDMATALKPFGFRLAKQTRPPSENMIVVATTIVAGAAFGATQLAVWLGHLLAGQDLWQKSAYFPSRSIEPFTWAIPCILTYGAAMIVADKIRARRIGRGTWFGQDQDRPQRILAHYLRVALISGTAGYGALVAWSLVFEPLSIDLARKMAPYAVLPALAGTFLIFHLDNAELERRGKPVFDALLQAAVCGFAGYAAADASLSITGVTAAYDLPAFVGMLHAIIGAALGWYLPRASTARSASRLHASNEIMPVLGMEVLERYRCDGLVAVRPDGRDIAYRPATGIDLDAARRLLQNDPGAPLGERVATNGRRSG
jgi:hypothetical protein